MISRMRYLRIYSKKNAHLLTIGSVGIPPLGCVVVDDERERERCVLFSGWLSWRLSIIIM